MPKKSWQFHCTLVLLANKKEKANVFTCISENFFAYISLAGIKKAFKKGFYNGAEIQISINFSASRVKGWPLPFNDFYRSTSFCGGRCSC